MNPNLKTHGVWTALVTPFLEDLSIDDKSWDKLVLLQKDAKVSGLVIAGSTGEGATLSTTEKLSLVKRTRALVGNELPLMASIGGNDTKQCVELAKLYEDAGADYLLVVTPPYNKPSYEGLKIHFESIASKVSIPLCLYHVPGRTAQRLGSECIAKLCEHPAIQMVKEASGDVAFFSEALFSSKAAFYSGDDPTYLASLAYGASGSISVISNAFPKEWVLLTQLFLKGEIQKARDLYKALFEMNQALYCEGNPTPLKELLSQMGFCESYVRPPLAFVTSESREKIGKALESAKAKLERLHL